MTGDKSTVVRCVCGGVIAIRKGNTVTSSLKHRARKKEIRVTLRPGQRMEILCDRCGQNNILTGN